MIAYFISVFIYWFISKNWGFFLIYINAVITSALTFTSIISTYLIDNNQHIFFSVMAVLIILLAGGYIKTMIIMEKIHKLFFTALFLLINCALFLYNHSMYLWNIYDFTFHAYVICFLCISTGILAGFIITLLFNLSFSTKCFHFYEQLIKFFSGFGILVLLVYITFLLKKHLIPCCILSILIGLYITVVFPFVIRKLQIYQYSSN